MTKKTVEGWSRLILGRRLSLGVGRCHRNHIMTSARKERLLAVSIQEISFDLGEDGWDD